jgi:hypothetical protein
MEKRIALRLSKDQLRFLIRYSRVEKRSMSAVVRMFIDDRITKQKNDIDKDFMKL